MASVKDIIEVTVNTAAARVAQAGFGVPLILSHSATWTERTRVYESLAEVLVDFAATTPEYKAARAIFAQPKSPPRIVIGRATSSITQRYAITPVASHSTVYTMTIVEPDGTEHVVSITSDASATVAEIITALKNAIDALSLAITTSDQTTYLRILANSAGAFWGISVSNVALLGIAQDHAAPSSPTLATDLAAIKAERDTWYGLITLWNSAAYVVDAAAWANSDGQKFYSADSNDSAIVTTTRSGDDDTGEKLYNDNLDGAHVIYAPRPEEFAAAAFQGAWLPKVAGSETTKFMSLTGVTAASLTTTQATNAKSKRVMIYTALDDTGTDDTLSITEEGVTSSGRWIDEIRGIHAVSNALGVAGFNLLKAKTDAGGKLSYDNEGFAELQGVLEAVLLKYVRTKFFRKDPAPSVVVPDRADIDDTTAATRIVPDVTATAYLAGAAHGVEFTLSLLT